MTSTTLVKAYAALAAVCFFWGTTYLAIRIGVETMPPFLFAGIRFLIAGGLVCLYYILKKTPLPTVSEWKSIVLISLLFFVIGNTSVVQAEQHISSGLAALICSAIPIWVVLINLIMSKAEKINSLIIAGLITGFAGLVMIFYDNLGDLSQPALFLSILFLLFGNLTWSYGTVYSKKIKWKTPFMYAAGLQMLVAGVLLSITGFLSGESSRFQPDFEGWVSLLYLALIGSIVSYGAYLYALAHLPSTVVSLYAYVNPIVAVVFGYLVLQEQFGLFTLLAMVVTIVGVYLVNSGFKAKQEQPMFLRKLTAIPALLRFW